MRITDFVMTLPTTMIIIVFLVVVPEYTIKSFIFIMSIFAWTGYTRIVEVRPYQNLDWIISVLLNNGDAYLENYLK